MGLLDKKIIKVKSKLQKYRNRGASIATNQSKAKGGSRWGKLNEPSI
jgi:hypothetical protein